MLEVKLEDLHLTAINKNIRNIELRLRTNKNNNGTEMTDSERNWWKEQLHIKRKEFRRACKKYGRMEEYNAFLEKQAEMRREEEILQLND